MLEYSSVKADSKEIGSEKTGWCPIHLFRIMPYKRETYLCLEILGGGDRLAAQAISTQMMRIGSRYYHMTETSKDFGLTSNITARLSSVNWDFEKVTKRSRIHDVHPYPARFIPQIPREIIRLFHPGDSSAVLDPFCGSGTTLVEAIRAGKPAIGVDVHPLAVLIAKVKTTPLTSSLSIVAQAIVNSGSPDYTAIPKIPRLDHWFLPDVQRALANLVHRIDEVHDQTVKDCLKVALSRIIVRVSNQESDTRYAAIQKDVTAGQVYQLFLESAAFIERAVLEAYGGFFAPSVECKLILGSILDVNPRSIGRNVGLVVTSPPYPNAYEYWLYHKYRMYWLGMDPLQVRKMEIGARPHYFRKRPATEEDFERQMTQVFHLLSRVMIPRALACFLVGRSILRGKKIDNGRLLKRAAEANGFSYVAEAERKISQTRKAFNPAVSTINQETILLFMAGGQD
jgi:DNA modification methylase